MELIYVIEDDDNIRDLVQIALEGFGFCVKAFEAAEPALEQVEQDRPSLAVFDLMLPGMDGLAAIKVIRKSKNLSKLPVIVLTAKDKELDKVIGLDGGADDYMTKPFGVLELGARVRSLLRRSGEEKTKEVLHVCDLDINLKAREVKYGDRVVELTLKEYELLTYLAKNTSRVVGRDELLDNVWGYGYGGETRTLDMHIRTLRQKLGEGASDCIKTIRGVGYRMVKTEE